MNRPPELTIVDVVTREHGEKFADEWIDQSFGSGAILEAFSETGVVEWPDDRDAQGRFHDIENEITQRITDQLRSAISETFVRIASEILARERKT